MVTKSNLLLLALGSIYALTTPEERSSVAAKVGWPGRRLRRGLVYRLPRPAFDAIEGLLMPVVRARLFDLGLHAEAMAFNLPHVAVAAMAGGATLAADEIAAALPASGGPGPLRLHGAHLLRTSQEEGCGWSFALDANDAAGVAVGNHTLVFSSTGLNETIRAGLLALADAVNALIPDGIAMDVRDASVVEFGPMGNAVRELYRISLADGRIWDTTSGEQLRTPAGS